jgi:hypothetical protein
MGGTGVPPLFSALLRGVPALAVGLVPGAIIEPRSASSSGSLASSWRRPARRDAEDLVHRKVALVKAVRRSRI